MATDDTQKETSQTESKIQDVDADTESVAGIVLGPEEEVHHDFRPSWTNYPKTIIAAIVFAIPTIGVSLGLLAWPWWKRRRTRFIITSDRVIIKRGRISEETTEVHLEDLRQIHTQKSRVERLARKGTIQLDTAHDECIELGSVPNHATVANTIREQRVRA